MFAASYLVALCYKIGISSSVAILYILSGKFAMKCCVVITIERGNDRGDPLRGCQGKERERLARNRILLRYKDRNLVGSFPGQNKSHDNSTDAPDNMGEICHVVFNENNGIHFLPQIHQGNQD